MRTKSYIAELFRKPMLLLMLIVGRPANAELVISVLESGNDVVVQANGTVNLTGATLGGTFNAQSRAIEPTFFIISAGNSDYYDALSGPTSVANNGGNASGGDVSGDMFGISWFGQRLYVPAGYVSGSFLSGSMTFTNETLAGAGFDSAAMYTWTLPSGDTVKLSIETGPPDPDGDMDGIPDAWEDEYFNGDANPTNDFDDDGLDNRGEYIAGTNPTNDMSFFKVDDFVFGTNGVITFATISQRVYSVRRATNLIEQTWIYVLSNKPGDGSDLNIDVTPQDDTAVYQIGVDLP